MKVLKGKGAGPVETFLVALDHPRKPEILELRRIILRVGLLAIGLAAGACASSSRALAGAERNKALLCRGRVSVRLPGTAVRLVSGRTVDPAGRPLPGVAVVLVGQDAATSVYQATSEETGRFVVGGVPDGRYLLKTCRGGFETVEMDLEVSGDGQNAPLVLAMAPGS